MSELVQRRYSIRAIYVKNKKQFCYAGKSPCLASALSPARWMSSLDSGRSIVHRDCGAPSDQMNVSSSAIQTINSDFVVVCAASDEAATESACNSQRQICRRNKLSTQFTNIGKISFCSTVDRIRSFHADNRQVGHV